MIRIKLSLVFMLITLIAFVFAGCDYEASQDAPSGYLGNGALTISGRVYTTNVNENSYAVFEEFTGSRKVTASTGDEGSITDGQLNITVSVPKAEDLQAQCLCVISCEVMCKRS